MLDLICDDKVESTRGEIPTFKCVKTVPVTPNPCHEQKLIRCCKELLTKVQLAQNSFDLLQRDQFLLLRASVLRRCERVGLPIPELPCHNYDQLLREAEQLLHRAKEQAQQDESSRQLAALARWQKKTSDLFQD